MRLSNAIVIGAGIGGLTSAIALARQGVAVTVLERADALREVGAGLQVSPNGLRVLKRLGVTRGLERRAVRARSISLRRFEDEREITCIDLSARTAPYLFVHRADLIAALAMVAKEHNVSFEFDAAVASVTSGPVAEVTMVNGGKRRTELVVGADGLHSVARAAVGEKAKARFTGQVAWRATVPNDIGHPPEARVTMGPKRHVVSYPLRAGQFVNIVAVEERKEWTEDGWHHLDDAENLRAAFGDFTGDAAKLLDAVEQPAIWGLHRHPVAKKWYADGIALVGDAAHPMLPFLAQGANMALEDAWVLADALEHAPIDQALINYQARRIDRVKKVVAAAQKNAQHYHYRPGPVRWVAHSGMSLISKVAPGSLINAFNWLYGYDVGTDS